MALALDALGAYLCKSQAYEAVQAAAKQVPGTKRRQVFGAIRTPALGADVTSVKCRGKWLALGLSVDPLSGLVLSVDRLPAEDAQLLQTWLTPIAVAVGARLLVSDEADPFKTVADQLGLDQQVCKARVVRNTDALVETLAPAVERDVDGSLATLGVSPAPAAAGGRTGRVGGPLCLCAFAPARPAVQPGLPTAAVVSGSLELVGTVDALPHVAGAQRRKARWP